MAGDGRSSGALGALRHLGTAGVVVAGIVALCLVLFGGGELDPAAAAETTAAASLDVIDEAVEKAAAGSDSFAAAEDNALLDVGDTVRTDEDGFAQVDWSDGSLARLDANTQLTVVDLAGEALAPQVTTRLDVGRVWNRVQQVTGEHGSYEVETAVGTAAVRGTAFSIECTADGICTISVWEGVLELTTPDGGVVRIEAGETVTIAPADRGEGLPILPPEDPAPEPTPTDGTPPDDTPDDTPPEPEPEADWVEVSRTSTTPDDLRASDPWIDDNLVLDEATGRFGSQREACAASLAGRNAHLANTPDRAIEVQATDTPEALGLTVAPLDTYDIRLALLGQEFTAGSGQVTSERTEWRDTVAVADYAVFGVGIYEVVAVTTGVDCRLVGYVNVVGRSPLTTVAGGIAALLSLLGFALVSASVRGRPGRGTAGRRVRSLLSGAVGGAGLAILLQQFGVFPLTVPLLGGLAGVGAVAGGALPRAAGPAGPAPATPHQPASGAPPEATGEGPDAGDGTDPGEGEAT